MSTETVIHIQSPAEKFVAGFIASQGRQPTAVEAFTAGSTSTLLQTAPQGLPILPAEQRDALFRLLDRAERGATSDTEQEAMHAMSGILLSMELQDLSDLAG